MKTCIHDSNPPIGVWVHPSFGTPSLVCGSHSHPIPSFSPERETLAPIARYYFRCRHCDELSPKADWGHGRVTCPICKKIAPAAELGRMMGVCPVCGGLAYTTAEGIQLRCEPCSERRFNEGPLPMPFLGWSFCDQPCQSNHKEGEHLL
jgi:hypothetical protein